MTLILLESWEGLAEPEDKYNVKAASLANIQTDWNRSGEQCLDLNYGYWVAFDIPLSDTGIVGFAFHYRAFLSTTGGTGLVLFCRADLEYQCFLSTDVWGHLRITSDGGQTYSKQSLRENEWNYIEVKWNAVNSIGADTFIVRVNGEEWINVPAGMDCQNQTSSGIGRVLFQGSNTVFNYYDDVYIVDLEGPAPNNDFLGDISIETLDPNGNGNTNQFTGSDADSTDNYLLVDETVPDDDTTYVGDATVSDIDLYAFEDMATTPLVIYAIHSMAVVKKTDASAKTGRLITRVNGSNYEGSDFSPTEAYGFHSEIWALNPDDSLAWELADVDGAEFGIKVQA